MDTQKPGEFTRTGVHVGAASEVTDHRDDIFFAAVEATRMPMIVTDPRQADNPVIFANPAFFEMTGYEPHEIIGSNCRFLQGPDTDRETVDEIRAAVSDRRDLATEILNYRKDGSTFWNALFVSPVYNRAGELVYFFSSQLDVSRRRDAEDALRQAQKMEALGQLTGGIAHDFNNLLQVMVGYLDLIRHGISKPEIDHTRLMRSLDNVQAATDKAKTLTQQLLAFARKQKLEGRTVNLNGLIAHLGELAERTLGEDVEIRRKLAPDLWNCRIDPTQAEVAILNVLINARDAMQGADRRLLSIETANVEVSLGEKSLYENLSPGRYVTLAITDTGHGMSPEVLARVMDPFFTTKEEGKGTGLGLSMVYGFAKQSGGAVRFYSEEGIGTTVRLYFQATDGSEVPSPRKAPARALDRAGEGTILVVEDRAEVAELACAILEDFGYTVHMTSNAREALDLLNGGTKIDLLFSDLIMPGGMNGVVLAREARQRQPKLKVLLTTGYAELSIERTDAGGSEFEVINKPYGRMELARKVRMVLDGPTGVS